MISNTEGALLLEQNPPAGLWGGLWVFPQCESEEQLEETYLKLGVQPDSEQVHEVKRHTFSHFHLDYKPVQITLGSATANAKHVADKQNQVWYNPQNPLSLGMPAPIKALLLNHPKVTG